MLGLITMNILLSLYTRQYNSLNHALMDKRLTHQLLMSHQLLKLMTSTTMIKKPILIKTTSQQLLNGVTITMNQRLIFITMISTLIPTTMKLNHPPYYNSYFLL